MGFKDTVVLSNDDANLAKKPLQNKHCVIFLWRIGIDSSS